MSITTGKSGLSLRGYCEDLIVRL